VNFRLAGTTGAYYFQTRSLLLTFLSFAGDLKTLDRVGIAKGVGNLAKQPMLKFVNIERIMPEKRDAQARRADFDEIYAEYADEKAKEQASRCSQCGVPYCQTHCPLHNNIPDWLRLTAEGRLQEAYELSQATNTFPEICGRICPQDRLCEGNCVIEQSGHGTVTIGSVEKYLTDTAWEKGWVKPIDPGQERAESVGIIGAGPGGLAAADVLRRAGIQVTVYDRYDRAGGLLTYGIPGFKLEKDVVMRRNDQLAQGGVKFELNCNVGTDISFEDLRAHHDAVLVATGVYKTRDLQAPGSAADGVVSAIDFLTASNRKSFGDAVPEFDSGALNAEGKRVVVIGGGDTAMDCVRTSVRQGAISVKCLYRRDRANMPGSQREVQNAEEEGVVFEWLSAPKGFAGDPVAGVMVQKMRLGAPDATGRQAPEVIEDADYVEDADLVIKALGFEPEDLPSLWNQPGLEVTRWGTIKADFTTGATALPGVYAVGDIVRGASLVVWAIKDGREAAAAILDQFNAAASVAAE
jgi:glutamate synthase (NADPH/NADH) small chain